MTAYEGTRLSRKEVAQLHSGVHWDWCYMIEAVDGKAVDGKAVVQATKNFRRIDVLPGPHVVQLVDYEGGGDSYKFMATHWEITSYPSRREVHDVHFLAEAGCKYEVIKTNDVPAIVKILKK